MTPRRKKPATRKKSSRVKQVASPVSTGGGGPDFERRVAAYYLAAALLGAVPRGGLKSGVTREVRFQRLFDDDPLDDLVVLCDFPSGEAKLVLQVKRDLVFGKEDDIFDEVIHACWQTFNSPHFTFGIDLFGVCLAHYSKRVDEYYQSVLAWARDSATAADFFKRLSAERLASETMRSFVKLIRAKLDDCAGEKVSDEDLWRFLMSLRLLRFDLHLDSSSDYPYVVEMLRSLLPAAQRDAASTVFDRLERYGADAAIGAGSLDGNALRRRLRADGITLLPTPNCRDDLSRLDEHASLILERIREDIGGLVVNRSELVAAAQASLLEAEYLELTGPPGNGKSAILKALVRMQQGQGTVLVFSSERLEGTGWNSFARDLRLERKLEELLIAAGSHPHPCVFIDGADRITQPGHRSVILDVLSNIKRGVAKDGSPKLWRVVVTARDNNLADLHSWLDARELGRARTLYIPELSAEEMQVVVGHHPRLHSLFAARRLDPVIKNPFMLNLLADPRVSPLTDATSRVVTETEIQAVWWERLVGSDDAENNALGRARQLALIEVGKQAAKAPGRRLIVESIEANTLTSLERDRILLRDPHRDVHRFAHDLLEDWVIFRVLNRHREELTAYLRELGEPLGLLRAVQLVGCALLEQNEGASEWRNLLVSVESESILSPRWRQALYTAPLISTRAEELLDKASPVLLADEGARLCDLLVVLRTVEVDPNFYNFPGAQAAAEKTGFVAPVLFSAPIPRWQTWTPLIGWLVKHAEALPRATRPEVARIFEMWQEQSPPGARYRREIGETAFAWLAEEEQRDRYV